MALVALLLGLTVYSEAQVRRFTPEVDTSWVATARQEQERAARELARMERRRLTWPEDRERFLEAARSAWAFLDGRVNRSTGLITPLGAYPYATMWDVASMIASVYSAHELGLLDDGKYAARMSAILDTLQRLALYDGRAFNKAYDTRSGAPSAPLGWSTTDLGRLLIWLRIAGSDARFEEAAEAIVRRLDFSVMVKSGYLWGAAEHSNGERETYPEGTIGYEQYAARGYALWGQPAARALRWQENAVPVTVMTQPVIADFRRGDRLTPEPFLRWGLEVGWDSATRRLVRQLLLALEERHRRTGIVTMTGEDAISEPPHYFYYYCIYANGLDFSVDVQAPDAVVDGPRWISAKAAYAFDALMPTRYTALAVEAVDGARRGSGWAAGVYEETGQSTGNHSINTAAIILTAALYHARGESILAAAAPGHAAGAGGHP